MSKLKCECGYVIVDQSDSLSYKADLLPDKLFYSFFDELEMSTNKFILAYENNSLKHYLINFIKKSNFENEFDIDNETFQSIFYHLISNHIFASSRQVYQCINCNRIWIQKNKNEQFFSFLPEGTDDGYKNILG